MIKALLISSKLFCTRNYPASGQNATLNNISKFITIKVLCKGAV